MKTYDVSSSLNIVPIPPWMLSHLEQGWITALGYNLVLASLYCSSVKHLVGNGMPGHLLALQVT